MRPPLAVLLLLSSAWAVAAQPWIAPTPTLWLPIVATQSNIRDALASVSELQRGDRKLLLVQSDNCHNLRKHLYLIVAGIHAERQLAESAIAEWRKQGVDDAYLRSCEIVVPSRLSLDIPILDPSLTRQRIEAVNWGLEDAISRVIALGNRWVALIIPRYESDPEDIREGLRIGVRLYNLDLRRSLALSSDCIDPEFAFNATHVALTCVNETAATYLLHRTQLYSLADGQVVAKEIRCVQPSFEKDNWICLKESVDARGVLDLKPKVMLLR